MTPDRRDDVLVVDDTVENLQVLESMLIQHGYTVRSALNGSTALTSALAQPPDLVLLDMRLPKMNGAEICRALKNDERTRAVPVIFISVFDSLTDKIDGFKEGGVDYITWPFQVEEVLARVSTHLAVARAQATLERKNAELERANRDHRRAEEDIGALNVQLELRKQELETANRDLESFSYSIAHDLRSPLRAIDGFVSIVLDEHAAALDDKAKGYLRRVQANGARMGTLVDAFLSLAHVRSANVFRQNVDLTAMAWEVEGRLRNIEPQHQVEISIAADMTVDADPTLMRCVLENLLGNAWKFTSKTNGASIQFGVETIEGKATYVVRDNGAGFDPAQGHKLFRQFQRLHATGEYDGTGIGLAIVDRIIRRHGGSIWADGAVGRGATFYFTI